MPITGTGEAGDPNPELYRMHTRAHLYFEEQYRPGDWVCSAWRSHYHALLAGIPPAEVKAAILTKAGTAK